MSFLALVPAPLKRWAAALVAALSIILGVFMSGKRTEREESRVEDLEKYVETKEKIDNVETAPTRDAAVKRLRDNGWTR